jgi:hypothetical protein
LQIIQGRRKLWKAGQLIVGAIQPHQGRRKPCNAGQLIAKTLQHSDALRNGRKLCQSQITEIEFSVDTVHKAFDCDVHGWLGCHLGVRVCLLFLIHLISIFMWRRTKQSLYFVNPSFSF